MTKRPTESMPFMTLRPSHARFAEAVQFHEHYRRACGPPRHNIFGMAAFLDAYLFAITSSLEFEHGVAKLSEANLLIFIVAMRNLAAHQSVLPLIDQSNVGSRPMHLCTTFLSRVVTQADFEILPASMVAALNQASQNYSRGSRIYARAVTWVSTQQQSRLNVADLMERALDDASAKLCFPWPWRTGTSVKPSRPSQ